MRKITGPERALKIWIHFFGVRQTEETTLNDQIQGFVGNVSTRRWDKIFILSLNLNAVPTRFFFFWIVRPHCTS